MSYEAYHVCVSCKRELSNYQMMYSDGICPHCGFASEDAATIVDCDRLIREKKQPLSLLRRFFKAAKNAINYRSVCKH